MTPTTPAMPISHGLADPAEPRSLLQPAAPAARLLSRDDCQAIAQKLLSFALANPRSFLVSASHSSRVRRRAAGAWKSERGAAGSVRPLIPCAPC